MNIVTTTAVFPEDMQTTESFARLVNVGYKYLDWAMSYCTNRDHPYMSESWRAWIDEVKAQADALGVRYTHAHACGDSCSKSQALLNGFEACETLGIRYMILHPVFSVNKKDIIDDDEFIRINREGILSLLPYAEKHNVIILTENLLWGSSISPLAVANLVKAVDSPYFGWCLDTGHLHCSGVPISTVRGVSVAPLSLHVQDNHGLGSGDQHILPGDGTIDWKEFLDILHELDYKGDLVLEAHHPTLDAPDEAREEILADLLQRAEKMRDYFETL